jgi:hypothetical protein
MLNSAGRNTPVPPHAGQSDPNSPAPAPSQANPSSAAASAGSPSAGSAPPRAATAASASAPPATAVAVTAAPPAAPAVTAAVAPLTPQPPESIVRAAAPNSAAVEQAPVAASPILSAGPAMSAFEAAWAQGFEETAAGNRAHPTAHRTVNRRSRAAQYRRATRRLKFAPEAEREASYTRTDRARVPSRGPSTSQGPSEGGQSRATPIAPPSTAAAEKQDMAPNSTANETFSSPEMKRAEASQPLPSQHVSDAATHEIPFRVSHAPAAAGPTVPATIAASSAISAFAAACAKGLDAADSSRERHDSVPHSPANETFSPREIYSAQNPQLTRNTSLTTMTEPSVAPKCRIACLTSWAPRRAHRSALRSRSLRRAALTRHATARAATPSFSCVPGPSEGGQTGAPQRARLWRVGVGSRATPVAPPSTGENETFSSPEKMRQQVRQPLPPQRLSDRASREIAFRVSHPLVAARYASAHRAGRSRANHPRPWRVASARLHASGSWSGYS